MSNGNINFFIRDTRHQRYIFTYVFVKRNELRFPIKLPRIYVPSLPSFPDNKLLLKISYRDKGSIISTMCVNLDRFNFPSSFRESSRNVSFSKCTRLYDPLYNFNIFLNRELRLIFRSLRKFRSNRQTRGGTSNVDTRTRRSSSVRISVCVLPLVVYYRQRNRKHRLSRKPFSSLSVHGLPAAIHVN